MNSTKTVADALAGHGTSVARKCSPERSKRNNAMMQIQQEKQMAIRKQKKKDKRSALFNVIRRYDGSYKTEHQKMTRQDLPPWLLKLWKRGHLRSL